MEKKMTDWEIIKQEIDFLNKYMADHELDERFEAILMAAEIERLQDEIKVLSFCIKTNGELAQEMNEENTNQRYEMENLRTENELYYEENLRLKAALAEKPDIVRCGECINYHGGIYTSAEDVESSQPPCCYYFGIHINDNDFCSRGTRKEAKDED